MHIIPHILSLKALFWYQFKVAAYHQREERLPGYMVTDPDQLNDKDINVSMK